MSGWHTVSLAEVQPSPWRNARGSTRELLAWPTADAWQVRISVADIAQGGPFSSYPHVERWFAVLEGAGVTLRMLGHEHRLTPASEPLSFDGDTEVSCTLAQGPTRDLNLMTQPGRASMERVAGPRQFQCPGQWLVAVYTHQSHAHLTVAGDTLDLPHATLAWQVLRKPTLVQVAAPQAWWMGVRL
jgi:environmental stress-induced protein Ves